MGDQLYVGVIGSGDHVAPETLVVAEDVGRGIALRGGILVCGGRGGVMEAACRGAKSAGGTTVGILPGFNREGANAYVDVSIPTGLGFALRNFITIRTCQAVIMLHGEVGTLEEAVLAYQHGIPLVAIASTGGWAERLQTAALNGGANFDQRKLVNIAYVHNAADAVQRAFSLIGTVPPPAKI
jgi:uncharacterized protein (TIGR00725 family)